MKKIFILLIAVLVTTAVGSQINKPDANYNSQVVSADWMPDGRSLLIAVVKFHKTDRKVPFFSRVFKYDIGSKQVTLLFENGGNLAPSPDGKTIAFLKRDDEKRTDIFFFDTETRKETILKTDTSRKNALSWSPDGKRLLYNTAHKGSGQNATIEICVLNLESQEVKQITNSGKDKSYDPHWSPDSKKIVYYLEKGDGHDQIWLTDLNGSFHRNLTNDTTTHNYFPSWVDERTILYTQSPETIMTMNIDGTGRKKVEGITSYHVKYNPVVAKLVYIAEKNNNVVLYDWKTKKETVILNGEKMLDKF